MSARVQLRMERGPEARADAAAEPFYPDACAHLADELDRLDGLLRLRTAAARRRWADRPAPGNPLCVSDAEVDALLGGAPEPGAEPGEELLLRRSLHAIGERIAARVEASLRRGVDLPLPRLTAQYGLSPFEVQAVLVCLAPELRRGYDRVYAYLQDDVTRRRPSVDLVLELLCESEAERWRAHALLAPHARLLQAGILQAAEDPYSPSGSSGLAQLLRLDPHVLHFLLGHAPAEARLASLAARVEPRHGWDDLVLPDERLAQLREMCGQVRHARQVYDGWGFGRKLVRGRGLSALFTGPPGTGKTLASEVVAAELGLDLYRVDLACVVSKYIGETEKNLSRIFAAAEGGGAVLFFDEADALFGKRTEVSDARDRYANIETSYLLQRMEEYTGIVVLASNLRENLDDAFLRRIRFVVDFPFPDAASRRRIWRGHFPPEAPVDAEVDWDLLAERVPVAGGSIRNIALHAAFLAAADGCAGIGQGQVLRAVRAEFEKIGKLWDEATLTGERN